MNEIIRIKPHHFVDIIASFGANATFTPHPYGHAVHTVAARILQDRDVLLEMELGADDICAPCRHNIGGVCDDAIETSFRPDAPAKKREWNLIIDRRWCDRLELHQDDRLTARELCTRLQNSAGGLSSIYREEPVDRIKEKGRKLKVGIAKYLESDLPHSGT